MFLAVVLAGGGAALYFFKFRKPKADIKGGDDLDEYDFGEDEETRKKPRSQMTPKSGGRLVDRERST